MDLENLKEIINSPFFSVLDISLIGYIVVGGSLYLSDMIKKQKLNEQVPYSNFPVENKWKKIEQKNKGKYARVFERR